MNEYEILNTCVHYYDTYRKIVDIDDMNFLKRLAGSKIATPIQKCAAEITLHFLKKQSERKPTKLYKSYSKKQATEFFLCVTSYQLNEKNLTDQLAGTHKILFCRTEQIVEHESEYPKALKGVYNLLLENENKYLNHVVRSHIIKSVILPALTNKHDAYYFNMACLVSRFFEKHEANYIYLLRHYA